jgi:hypothetical protein
MKTRIQSGKICAILWLKMISTIWSKPVKLGLPRRSRCGEGGSMREKFSEKPIFLRKLFFAIFPLEPAAVQFIPTETVREISRISREILGGVWGGGLLKNQAICDNPCHVKRGECPSVALNRSPMTAFFRVIPGTSAFFRVLPLYGLAALAKNAVLKFSFWPLVSGQKWAVQNQTCALCAASLLLIDLMQSAAGLG